ncbi:MAG: flagellar basal body rod protein FlgC [Cypionkella sp.]|jgi:flagellar basal-body rod protein FlgC|nr:flagellar basal body rod protein FlgC [Cypionkella sp.]
MHDLSKSLSLSASAMQAQAIRLRHVAENIANADTPGYQRKLTAFRPGPDGMVETGRVRLDPRPAEKIHDPGHPLADEAGYRLGSNVDLVVEIADAREAQRSYEANLRLFDQARQMTQGLFELIRR